MPKETFFNLKEDKQERILRCAISEFRQHGFTGANIGTIAKKADVAKGSMYQYFNDKNELFVYCVTWSMGILMEKVSARRNRDDQDMFEYYSTDISDMIRLVREEKDLSFFTQDLFLGKFQAIPDDSITEMMRIADDYTVELIRKEQEKGSVRTDIDTELLKLFLLGATTKVKQHFILEAEKSGFDISDDRMEGFKHVIDDMMELLKNGIGAK